MIRGFYTASAGLRAYQEQMNLLSNNMANVNTPGFKAMRTGFTDLLYQNLNRPGAENPAMVGHGVKINRTDLDMGFGGLLSTDRLFDVAVTGAGDFFMVEDGEGEIRYTRTGAFSLNNEDGTYYLVDSNGYRVLDEDESPIEVEFDEFNDMEFDPAVIGVARFANPYGLHLLGNNCYAATDVSGEPEILEEPEIRVGYLEGSNVDVSNEMVQVIEASKAFSFASRMLQTADEVEQIVNGLR